MALLADSRSLASGGWYDGAVWHWEVATGQVRQKFSGHRGRVFALAFAADGKTLVSGGGDTTALLWDAAAQSRLGVSPQGPLSTKEFQQLWDQLSAGDAAAARGFRILRRAIDSQP